MSLVDVKLAIEMEHAGLPVEVGEFLQHAVHRLEQFTVQRYNYPILGFVPCDFVLVYRWLEEIRRRDIGVIQTFCEWGSGFGVVPCLAAMLGLDACGIESDAELVEKAQQLARDFNIPARFYQGSFIPPGGQVLVTPLDQLGRLNLEAAPAYKQAYVDPDHFDLIFAYSFPGEDRFIENVFERYAARHALLLTYHGAEDIRLRCKSRTSE